MPERTGSACVAAGTWVWLKDGDNLIRSKIEEVPVVWDDVKGVWNDDPSTIKPILSPLSKKLVYPIWRLGGEEENPMVRIPVEFPTPDNFHLKQIIFELDATEWHPIIKQDPVDGELKIIPADFVRRDQKVCIYSSHTHTVPTPPSFGRPRNPVPTGSVAEGFDNAVDTNSSTAVCGLGLASKAFFDIYAYDMDEKKYLEESVSEPIVYAVPITVPINWRSVQIFFDGVFERFTERSEIDWDRINNYKPFVEAQGESVGTHSRSHPLGLELKDHVLFTNNIATGALTMQYLMVKKLEEGLAFKDLEPLFKT